MESSETRETGRGKRLTLFQWCLLLFLFFAPMKAIELPSVFFGFSVNFARFFAMLLFGMVLASIAIRPQLVSRLFSHANGGNPFVTAFVWYAVFSIGYYYLMLALGNTVLYGSGDFFFRSWRGRPLGQFLSLLTNGIVVYAVVQYEARASRMRARIEQVLAASILTILGYGIIQQIFYRLGLPVTGRDFYEGLVPTITINGPGEGFGLLRFYSLAGEPRQFGAFALSAFFFYWAYSVGKRKGPTAAVLLGLVLAFLLTFSTSALLAAGLTALVLVADTLLGKRLMVQWRLLRVPIVLFAIVATLFWSQLVSTVGQRTAGYVEQFRSAIRGNDERVAPLVFVQSLDLAPYYYIRDFSRLSALQLLFGTGYGNYTTGVADIIERHFRYDIVSKDATPSVTGEVIRERYDFRNDPTLSDTNVGFAKHLVEGGIVAVLLDLGLFLYTIKTSTATMRFFRTEGRSNEYLRALLLRYAFIASFVSSMVLVSFNFFIFLGLIVADAKRIGVVEKHGEA